MHAELLLLHLLAFEGEKKSPDVVSCQLLFTVIYLQRQTKTHSGIEPVEFSFKAKHRSQDALRWRVT